MNDFELEELEMKNQEENRAELKKLAFNLLIEDGIQDREEWVDELINQYPDLIESVFCGDSFETAAMLAGMWDCDDYCEPVTGYCFTYREWAEYLSDGSRIFRDLQDALDDEEDFYRKIIRDQSDLIAVLKEKLRKAEEVSKKGR